MRVVAVARTACRALHAVVAGERDREEEQRCNASATQTSPHQKRCG